MADKCRSHARFTNTRFVTLICFSILTGVLAYGITAHSQQPSSDRAERARRMSKAAEERGLAEPFKGISTDGNVVRGLFPVRSTGISNAPVRTAAEAFLTTLTPEQRAQTMFSLDDPEWRKWMNQHFYIRQGIGFKDMAGAQREAAFGLLSLRASTSTPSCGRQTVTTTARTYFASTTSSTRTHTSTE